MALFIASAAVVTTAQGSAAGLDLWSGAPGAAEQHADLVDGGNCEMRGVIAMLCHAMRHMATLAISGDHLQIVTPIAEEKLNGPILSQQHLAMFSYIELLENIGVEVSFIAPTKKHSGIHHAKNYAQMALNARKAPVQTVEHRVAIAAE